jgi:hypothetical protein
MLGTCDELYAVNTVYELSSLKRLETFDLEWLKTQQNQKQQGNCDPYTNA